MRRAVTVIVLFVLAGLVVLAFRRFGQGTQESPYITFQVQRGEITQAVSATGTLQAVVTVQVGSQVSGTIAKLYADFNSPVKKDQVIAELEQAKFRARVDEAKANLLAAQARAAKAKVAMEDARRGLSRSEELKKRDFISQSELDAAQTAFDAAAAQFKVAEAEVGQAQAALNQASVDLTYTIIRSPVDGIVISRNVDVGQTVAASLQAPTLFTIANDLSKMEVHTNVDEADVGNVWVGQEVTFTVDAYPARRFKGQVFQVRHAPTVVQNVVTYDAVVRIDNKDLVLKPGMTANVEFMVSHKSGVLKIPNVALRFRPPEEKQEAQEVIRQASRSRGAGARGGERSRRARGGGGREGRWVKVYLLKDQKEQRPTPVEVRLGITDGSYTEVMEGEIEQGEPVIVALADKAKPSNRSSISNLFQVRGLGWFR